MGAKTYLAWQLDRRQPITRQIATAAARFEERLGVLPTELLAHSGSGLAYPGLVVREERSVPAVQVWLGADNAARVTRLEEAA